MNVRVALILGLLFLCAGAALALLFSPRAAGPTAEADFAAQEGATGARRPASLMPAKPTGAGHARVQHNPTTADQRERAGYSREEQRTVTTEESSSSFSWGEFFSSGQGESLGWPSNAGEARSGTPRTTQGEEQKSYGIGGVGSSNGGSANSATGDSSTPSANDTTGTAPIPPPPPIVQSPLAIQNSAGGYTNGLTGGNYKVNVSLGLTPSEVTGTTGGSYKVKVNAQGQIAR